MKQNITQKQWDEISLSDKANFKHYPISIGDMIEFLGDNWLGEIVKPFAFKAYNEDLSVIDEVNDMDNKIINANNLCDNLFEAVKYKLKI